MKKIKFSVLMSVYYKEKPEYLKESLDSIINQTLKPNEIVLVEDGPLTKELDKLINEYEKQYDTLKVIKLKENKGLGIALNEGLKHCSYDYVARMDSDDISLPNRFEVQIKYLEEHPEIDIIGTNIHEFDNQMKKHISNKNVPEKQEEIKKYIKQRNPINHVTVVYKKQKVLEAKSYIDCPLFEDYYLWCRMFMNNCTFYNIQDYLMNVRAGLDMVNRRGGKQYNKNIINFQKKIKKIGLINEIEYLKNILIRISISSCPKFIRMKFYELKLRG